MNKGWVVGALLCGLAAVGTGAMSVGVSALEARGVDPEAPRALGPARVDVRRGAIHVHTAASDGSGDLDTVARAARAAGLDFVVVTDHDRYALPAGQVAAWMSEVLVISGAELSTSAGHLLVMGVEEPVLGEDPTAISRQVQAQGGVSVVAHPSHSRRGWKGALPPGAGLEVWNGDMDLRDDLPSLELLAALGLRPWWPRAAAALLYDRQTSALALFDDAINRGQLVPMVASSDSHAPHLLGWPLIDHGTTISQVINYVNLRTPPATSEVALARQILSELQAGSNVLVWAPLGDPGRVEWQVELPSEADPDVLDTATSGSVIPFSPGGAFELALGQLPEGLSFDVVLHRDGREVSRSGLQGTRWRGEATRPGVWRVEVWSRTPQPRPWIMTSPLWLIDPGREEEP